MEESGLKIDEAGPVQWNLALIESWRLRRYRRVRTACNVAAPLPPAMVRNPNIWGISLRFAQILIWGKWARTFPRSGGADARYVRRGRAARAPSPVVARHPGMQLNYTAVHAPRGIPFIRPAREHNG